MSAVETQFNGRCSQSTLQRLKPSQRQVLTEHPTKTAAYKYVLIKFSIISCRPLLLGVISPFSSMYRSSDAKLDLPLSISAPTPESHEL